MNSFHQAIGLEQVKQAGLPRFHDRAVVPRAKHDARIARKAWQQSIEQPVLAEGPQVHGWLCSWNASVVRVTALKSACIVIETRIEPLHS